MLLSVENLKVSYDRIKALHGISFHIDEGEIVCIIGANGAGKSTTLRAISRMVPVEGETQMTYMGRDLLAYQADKVVSELGISHVPDMVSPFIWPAYLSLPRLSLANPNSILLPLKVPMMLPPLVRDEPPILMFP